MSHSHCSNRKKSRATDALAWVPVAIETFPSHRNITVNHLSSQDIYNARPILFIFKIPLCQRIHRRPWLQLNMDTPEKKPANSMANIPMVTANAITNLKRKDKSYNRNSSLFLQLHLKKSSYFLSSLSYCSCVKSKGKPARTLFSC